MCLLSLPLPPALPSTQPIGSGAISDSIPAMEMGYATWLAPHPSPTSLHSAGLRLLQEVWDVHIPQQPEGRPVLQPGVVELLVELDCVPAEQNMSEAAPCLAGLRVPGKVTGAWHLGTADRSCSTVMKATMALSIASLALFQPKQL